MIQNILNDLSIQNREAQIIITMKKLQAAFGGLCAKSLKCFGLR